MRDSRKNIPNKKALLEGRRFCLRNAGQFIDDAEMLISRKSCGHAFSLAVLADEETAKAFVFFLLAEGLMDFDEKVTDKQIRNHRYKQRIAQGVAFGRLLSLLLLEDILRVTESRKRESPKEILRTRNEAIQSTVKRLERASESGTTENRMIEETMKSFEQLEKRKQLGFYVGIDEHGNVLSPDTVSCEEAELYVDSVYVRFQLVSKAFGSEMTESERGMFYEILDKTRKARETKLKGI